MDYCCELSDKNINPKSKYKLFKSGRLVKNSVKAKLTIENPDINNVDKTFYEYIIEQNKNVNIISLNANLK